MKKQLILAVLLSCTNMSFADLRITGVFDGPLTGGLPKGVELYSDESIDDLSAYGIGSANNGGGTDGEEFSFPSIAIEAGQYLYIASESDGFEAFMGFAPDFVSSAMSINGDDAIELFKGGLVIDTFGEIDVDGTGTAWDYMDGWAFRQEGGPTGAFDISQWQFSGPKALEGVANNLEGAIPLAAFSGGGSNTGGDGGPLPDAPLVLISAVQGNPDTYQTNSFGDTDVSPLIGQVVMVEAVVVGDFQNGDSDDSRNLGGFYLQEESTDEDGNPLSSEGIFVYTNGQGPDVALGDLVRVTGTVAQYFGETQLTNITGVEILAQDQLGSVTPAVIILNEDSPVTLNQNGAYQPDLEAYEGMLVTFAQTLTIAEQFQLDRFNEIKLVAGPRPVQFTQLNAPNALLYEVHQQQLGARRITYDDGLNSQNNSINQLAGFAPYTEATAPRMGDTVTGLTGVLDYKWSGNSASGATWRIRAHQDGNIIISSSLHENSPNPRASAPSLNGDLKMASLNVLNFFATLDNGSQQTAVGQSPRGADDLSNFGVEPATAEFDRQLAKLVNAITSLNADVLGLVEIENDFDALNDNSTAIEILVNAVNAALGEEVYAYVYPQTRFVGTDAIAVALVYNQLIVEPAAGTIPALLDDEVAQQLPTFAAHDFNSDPIFNGPATNRVSLAASFTHKESQVSFTAVVNHFKSKGSSGLTDESSLDFDQRDGAGYWNQRRTHAAMAVVDWLATQPTGLASDKHLVMGDLNAYAMEAPVQFLLDNGFNLTEDSDAYSYVFDGQVGTLDYLLVSDSLLPFYEASQIWHINADEADALDYNLDFGRSAYYFDATSATRYSDHDPIIVSFNLASNGPSWHAIYPWLINAIENKRLKGVGRYPLPQKIKLWLYVALIKTIDLNAADVNDHNDSNGSQKGEKKALCAKLNKAMKLSDALASPKDWVQGAALSELYERLVNNASSLGCEFE
ncbi:MAG TPA: ExeM/NucH family extracellular endonuclease [Marinagarivorans sp.]